MSNSTTQPRNLEALILGTGEFSFSPGAVSIADARAKGYRDFGNIVTVGFKPEVEVVEHEGSYRGVKRVDKRLATKGVLGYGLKCDELTRENLKIALGGSDAAAFIQPEVSSLTAADTLVFSSDSKALPDRWYDIAASGVRIREISELIVPGVAVNCALDGTGNTVDDEAHGLSAGSRVMLAGTLPAELNATTVYYVRDVTADDFKLAATSSGSAIDFTGNGADVSYMPVLESGAGYVADLKLGRVRFLAERATSCVPRFTAAAVAAGTAASLLGITPLTSLIQSGYGRITIFDDAHPNKVVYDHVDFSCQVSFESGADLDGKKVAEIDFKVLVTDIVGTVYTAE